MLKLYEKIMHEYEIYDCLYGRQLLSEDDYKLILVPELQRLRYVRLSNIDSISLTGGSNISRYEHSLGTFFLARTWCRINSITGYKERCIKKAALYHDICSAPFGHSFQYIFEDNDKNSSFEHQDLKKIRENGFLQEIDSGKELYGRKYRIQNMIEPDELSDIDDYINGKGDFGKLISSDIDFDNIDNVIRLSFHIGILEPGDFEIPLKIIQSMMVQNQQVVFTENGLPFLKRWYEIRRKLYELLLTKWSDFSEKAMLTYALELCYANKSFTVSQWKETDSDLLQLLYKATGDDQEVSRIAERLLVGDLYFPFAIFSICNTESYSNISIIEKKRLIEKELKDSTGFKFIFHPILDKNKTNRVLNIHLVNGKTEVIGDKKDQLLIGLFSPSEISIVDKERINEKITQILEAYGIIKPIKIFDPYESIAVAPVQGLLL